jgi:hypothetical protein
MKPTTLNVESAKLKPKKILNSKERVGQIELLQ